MPNLDDDLDWLYRRGAYADDAPTAAQPSVGRRGALRPAGAGPAPTDRTPSVAPQQPPTPVPSLRSPRTAPQPVVRPEAAAAGASVASGAKPRRKRHLGRWIALVLLALLAYLVAVPALTWTRLSHVDYEPAGERPQQQPGTLLLLAGSDSREGLTSKQMHDLGTGSEGGNVADTIMLLYMPPSGKPALISVPRDSYLPIPGHGKNKINASYAFGGPKLLTQTLEQNTGLRIDGYVGIGFGGFVSIIDALGGIEQCPTYDINDDGAHLNIKKGCQNMDGVTALKYVRMRHADPLGDLGRVQRQRGMITAVAKKAASPLSVLNPVTYYNLNAAGAAALKTDAGTGPLDLGRAGWSFFSISRGDGVALTVPVGKANLSTSNAGSAVQWDKTRAPELFAAIARGDSAALERFAKP